MWMQPLSKKEEPKREYFGLMSRNSRRGPIYGSVFMFWRQPGPTVGILATINGDETNSPRKGTGNFGTRM
jgi:hypothetical protein